MKTGSFLLQTIVCATLMHGMTQAAPSGQVRETTSADGAETTASNRGGGAAQSASIESVNGRDAKGQRDHRRALGKDLARNHTNLPKTKHPRTVPRNLASSRSATAFHSRQPGSGRSSGVEEGSLLPESTLKNTATVRPPNIVRPNPATVSHPRHHSPNPPIVDGLANSKSDRGVALNGSDVGRRR